MVFCDMARSSQPKMLEGIRVWAMFWRLPLIEA